MRTVRRIVPSNEYSSFLLERPDECRIYLLSSACILPKARVCPFGNFGNFAKSKQIDLRI